MPWALEPVLAEIEADTDAIVFGGDFIGGPYPAETLELVRSLDAITIRGNAERDPSEWDRSRLLPAELAWVQTLPVTRAIDSVFYCHATPTDDLPGLTIASTADRVRELFPDASGTYVIGHTHHQFRLVVDDLRVVNAGSIGVPWEDDVAAFWTLVVDGEPQHRRTPIDVERAIREIRPSGWPRGERFIAENLRTAFSRDAAVARIES